MTSRLQSLKRRLGCKFGFHYSRGLLCINGDWWDYHCCTVCGVDCNKATWEDRSEPYGQGWMLARRSKWYNVIEWFEYYFGAFAFIK